jgi:transposase
MEARVVNNLAPAAAHDGAVRCLLAIELSKKSWVVAVNTPLSDKISLYKLKNLAIGKSCCNSSSGSGSEFRKN